MEQILNLVNENNYKEISALVTVLKYKYDPKYIELEKSKQEKVQEKKKTAEYKKKNCEAVKEYYKTHPEYRQRQNELRTARAKAKREMTSRLDTQVSV